MATSVHTVLLHRRCSLAMIYIYTEATTIVTYTSDSRLPHPLWYYKLFFVAKLEWGTLCVRHHTHVVVMTSNCFYISCYMCTGWVWQVLATSAAPEKVKRHQWNPEGMQAATKGVKQEGRPVSAALKQFCTPRKTLDDFLKGRIRHGTSPSPSYHTIIWGRSCFGSILSRTARPSIDFLSVQAWLGIMHGQ